MRSSYSRNNHRHVLTKRAYLLARYPPFYDENPIGIYQKILAGRLDIPRHVESKAKDIIKRLLTIDRTNRLGEWLDLLIYIAPYSTLYTFAIMEF